MQSTLLIGNYDWDAERMPKEEFEDRIRTFWERMPESCAGLAVYGDRRNNAEMAYFGHLVPKLRDSVALIPRSGEPTMLVAGGRNMVPTSGRQTWMKAEPLSDLPAAVAQWKQALGAEVAAIGIDGVRLPVRKALAEALGPENTSKQAAEVVRAMMRRKSLRELAEIRRGCAMLAAAVAALNEAVAAGKTITACMADAEHAAVKMRAMEVRSLFSADGGRTLRPFISPLERKSDSLQAYIAVRSGGYWADAHVRAGKRSDASVRAAEGLKKVIAAMKPGVAGSELARIARDSTGPYGGHPLTGDQVGNGIGLALDEGPYLAANADGKLEAGGVYSMRVGASDGGQNHAIASAMVAVTAGGSEVFWSQG
jgi:Xaa-Pro aminopeptidase